MSTDLSWPQRYQLARTALAEKLERSSWMQKAEFPVVAITAPILTVLAAWLGSVLGLALGLNLAVATILGLVVVWPSMRKATLSSTPIETDATRFTLPTNHVGVVSNSFVAPVYEGWSGQMENSTSLNDLTGDQLELISELLGAYQEGGDLTQPEWASVQSALEIVDARLEVI